MNKYNIYRCISLSLILILIFILQNNRYGFSIMGIKIDLLPAYIASIAIIYDYTYAMGFGFLAGIFVDISRITVEGIFSIFYMLFAVYSGLIFRKYLRAKISAAILCTSIAMITTSFITYFSYLYLVKDTNFLFFIQTMCSEILISLIFLPLIFYSILWVEKFISRKEKEIR